MRGSKYPVKLDENEREELKKIQRARTSKQRIVMRANIILMVDESIKLQDIAQHLSVQKNVVTVWMKRWRDMAERRKWIFQVF